MKSVIVARHAKSTWKDKFIEDIDRPLKERGIFDAYDIASKLKEKEVVPDLMLSSPATRALHTAIIFSRLLDYPLYRLAIHSEIYSANLIDLMELIERTSDEFDTIMMFGHDPSFTNLVNRLANLDLEKVATTGTVKINFQIDSWTEISKKKGKLAFYLKPNRALNSV
ncbi:MAG: histidine phosphatase family protein [Flavobacteriales bacterium]|nr:histidine phosphatase family protein [Flavobacteriales bacterium]